MPAPLERSGGGSCALTGAAGNRTRAKNVSQHNKYALRITRNRRNYPRAGEKEERGNKYPTAEAFKFLFFPRSSKGAGTGAETII